MTLLALAVAGRGLADPQEPVLHADDLGLLRGQAAFETTRVYGGRPFRLDEHLERLTTSADRIGLPPVDGPSLIAACRTALAAAGEQECVLRVYWTGGREGAAKPTGLALVSPLPEGLDERRERGIALIALQLAYDTTIRTASPWLLPGVKSTSYAVNMAAEAEARRRGAEDAVFLSADDAVLEGPVTNVWWLRGGTLFTPSLDLGILAGVTRSEVLQFAERLGYTLREGHFSLGDLAAAEEAFTSSSVREIMPVISLDGTPIGEGRPGPASAAVQAALREAACAG
jgi:4-amino-4-deoxychorismate lyase